MEGGPGTWVSQTTSCEVAATLKPYNLAEPLLAGRAHVLTKMVLSILASGVGISAQDGGNTPSATRNGMKASGKVTPCKGKAGSHSWTVHTMNAAGKQGSHGKGGGALLMAKLIMKDSSRACCGMVLVHCTRLVSESIWVRSSMNENNHIIFLWDFTMYWLQFVFIVAALNGFHDSVAASQGHFSYAAKQRSCQPWCHAEAAAQLVTVVPPNRSSSALTQTGSSTYPQKHCQPCTPLGSLQPALLNSTGVQASSLQIVATLQAALSNMLAVCSV